MKRLLKNYDHFDSEKSFPDRLWLYASGIEDSLILGGATPGKDYTYLDLYKMALDLIKNDDDLDDLNIIYKSA